MNLLFVVHNWVGYGAYGGTEIHVQSIVNLLLSDTQYQLYVLFPNLSVGGLSNNYLLIDLRSNSTQNILLSSPITGESYHHQEFTEKFSSFLLEKKIDLVHFFHLIKFPLDLPLVAHISGAKTVVAFHDYYFVCPQFNFLKQDNQFCDYPNVSLPTCDLCLKRLFDYSYGTQQRRQILVSKVLYHTNAVHYMCEDEKSRILSAYPHLESKTSITMGVGLDRKPDINNKINIKKLPMQVACMGNFDTNKGAILLLQIIDYYHDLDQSNIVFNIYGDVRSPYARSLTTFAKSKIVNVHGSYKPNQLPELTKNCHIALFASIWPETFALTLSEAWSCGLIPVAPNLGAFNERIIDGKNGFLYNYKDFGSLINLLDRLLAFKQEDFISLLHEIAHTEYPSLQYNLSKYSFLYKELNKEKDNIKEIELVSRTIQSLDDEFWYASSSLPSDSSLASKIITGNANNIFKKAWNYYKDMGLRSTVFRVISYAKSRIIKNPLI